MASFVLSVTAFVGAENPSAVNIVPRPVSVRYSTGTFILSSRTRILASDPESRRIAGLLNEFLLNQLDPNETCGTATAHGKTAATPRAKDSITPWVPSVLRNNCVPVCDPLVPKQRE